MTAAPTTTVRGNVLVAAAAAVGIAGITAAVVAPSWASTSGPVVCPFRLVTGLPCPGCGLTRSWIAVGHGDLAAAFADNVFGPISMAFVAAMILLVLTVGVRAPRQVYRVAAVVRHPLVWLVAGVWVAYGVARAIDAGLGTGWFPAVT